MLSVVHTPAAPLSAFVANLWLLSDAPSHPMERVLPSGTLELVINLHEDEFRIHDSSQTERVRRFSGAMVSGAYDSFFVIDARAHTCVMGVHFKPGGAVPIIGHPAAALANSHVDLEALWGPGARALRERLCSAATPAARFQLLESALLARLERSVRPHDAVQVALAALRQGGTVAEIVQRVGLSHRRLIELFTREVGLTPKLYGRVERFQRASLLARRSAPDWAAVAARCGYFDQSHLIRDFIAFSGLSPGEFLRHAGPQLKHDHLALPRGRAR